MNTPARPVHPRRPAPTTTVAPPAPPPAPAPAPVDEFAGLPAATVAEILEGRRALASADNRLAAEQEAGRQALLAAQAHASED